MKGHLKKMVLMLLVSLLVLLPCGREALAEEESTQTDGQWVFLLPMPDDQNTCTFFAKPSTAGYSPDSDTQVSLTIQAEDKSYEVTLDPVAGSGGWLASPQYTLSPLLLSGGYQAHVQILQDGTSVAETTVDDDQMTAAWPEVTGGSVKVKQDQQSFALDKWVKASDSPLFRYSIEDQSGCSVQLDSDQIVITAQDAAANFDIVVSDPAGNRKVAEVTVNQAKISMDPMVIAILAAIVAAVVLILMVMRRRRQTGEAEVRDLTDAICDVEDQIGAMRSVIDNAKRTWRRFETAKADLVSKGQTPSAAVMAVGRIEDSNAYCNAEMVKDELEQVFNVLNYKMPRKETLTAEEKNLDVRNYIDASWRAEKMAEARGVADLLYDRCDSIERLTAGMQNRLEVKPLLHDVQVQLTEAGESVPWAGFIAHQEDDEKAKAIELDRFPLFRGQERRTVSDLLGGLQLRVIGDDDHNFQIIADSPCLAAGADAQPDSSIRVRYNAAKTICVVDGGKVIAEMTIS